MKPVNYNNDCKSKYLFHGGTFVLLITNSCLIGCKANRSKCIPITVNLTNYSWMESSEPKRKTSSLVLLNQYNCILIVIFIPRNKCGPYPSSEKVFFFLATNENQFRAPQLQRINDCGILHSN